MPPRTRRPTRRECAGATPRRDHATLRGIVQMARPRPGDRPGSIPTLGIRSTRRAPTCRQPDTMPRDIAPELSISVTGAHVVDHAAVPTLAFVLGIEANGAAIRALMLRADIRIALARRAHDVQTRERLLELFGTPAQWRAAPQ